MLNQLRALHTKAPEAVLCTEFGSLDELGHRLASIFSDDPAAAVAAVRAAWTGGEYHHDASSDSGGLVALAGGLQRALSGVEAFCGAVTPRGRRRSTEALLEQILPRRLFDVYLQRAQAGDSSMMGRDSPAPAR